ncbi:5052_t:CDS:2 [Entrophospora sp. SA101]|nr:5052_t:CDS:2 [Entrophospora sp. SA101]
MTPIKTLWQKARPAFKLPRRKKLSNELLDQVFIETKEEVDKLIESAEYISLVSDGWTSITQEHWTNYILTTPKPVFLKANTTGEVRQTAENIAADIEDIIKTLDINKLSAVVTDNASVMKKAWGILSKNYPGVFFLGCISHNLNLLINDIVKISWVDIVVKDSKKVVKYFKAHLIPSAVFKRHQKANYQYPTSLKLPVKTRWGSSVMCLQSVIKNKLALELTITELSFDSSFDLDSEVKLIIQSQQYWNNIVSTLIILNKLFDGIKFYESDQLNLAYFYDWYQNLFNSDDNLNYEIQEIIEKRWEKIYNPIMMVAYFLNPKFKNHVLPENCMNETKMTNIILNYRIHSDYSVDISPNATIGDLKYKIKEKVPFDNFDLYVNDISRDVKYFNIDDLGKTYP